LLMAGRSMNLMARSFQMGFLETQPPLPGGEAWLSMGNTDSWSGQPVD
jgi:hypothetical protein